MIENLPNGNYTSMVVLSLNSCKARPDAATKFLHTHHDRDLIVF